MRSVEVTGKTLEEAKAAAAEQLGVSEDELSYEIIEEPKRFLGLLGTSDYRITASVQDTAVQDGTDEPAAAEAPGDEPVDEPAAGSENAETEAAPPGDGSVQQLVAHNALEALENIISLMDLDAEVTLGEVTDEEVALEVIGTDAHRLVGRQGATLDALQLIVAVMANRGLDDGARVIVDAEGYREQRTQLLEEMACSHAEQAKEAMKEIVIKDLKPYERRIIHLALKDDPDIETYSEGEGNDRHIVISPKT